MNILTKKQINSIAYILIAIAVLASLYLAVQRINIERGYDQVQIIVNNSELFSLANANNLEVKELAQMLQEKGVTGVLVKEISLGDLVRTGQISFHQGGEVKLTSFGEKLPSQVPLSEANVIIAIHNKALENQLVQHLTHKLAGIEYYPGEISVLTVPVNLPNSDGELKVIYDDLKDLGVGFDIEALTELADLGMQIVPQVRDWPHPSLESLDFMVEEVKKIPNLSILMFNDEQVPGNPDKLAYLANLLTDSQGKVLAPIGIVEFFEQKGINKFAVLLNKETVRIHSISLNEMKTYTPQAAIDRWELAVKERNIRTLFVRFFGMSVPAQALETNLNYLEQLKTTLEGNGYNIGRVKQIDSPLYSRIIVGLIGLGVIAGGVLLLMQKNWRLLAIILGPLGALIWAAILYLDPLFARKLMALASVIVFPTLAFLVVMREKERTLLESVLSLLRLSLISLIGALLMVGLLADKLFMLKLDQFAGVKIAHIIPLGLIPVLIFLFDGDPITNVKKLLDRFISYKVAFLAGVVLAAAVIYVLRTGNVDTNLVLGIEQKMRDALQNILGVRPRTKEFLIGHPFTLLILYYGLTRKNWVLILPAIIGQVSLVNTYAHIHTPLLISLVRSFNGLWLGIIFGIALIVAWKAILRVSEKLKIKHDDFRV
ncbi:MAG: hypothetical protein GXY91_05985 [Clostridia bacterium]|nr:hypothetical protein [Clostridia bacterium]